MLTKQEDQEEAALIPSISLPQNKNYSMKLCRNNFDNSEIGIVEKFVPFRGSFMYNALRFKMRITEIIK